MKTVVLNWSDGENDPFTVMNAAIAQHLRACGKDVATVQLSDSDWTVQLVDLSTGGIDFVLTWQGLGSGATINDQQGDQSFWEMLKVPLICLHQLPYRLQICPEMGSDKKRHKPDCLLLT